MRYATRAEERDALALRVADARNEANKNGSSAKLNEFEAAVQDAKAVINKRIGVLDSWISSGNQLYLNYHQQVRAGGRFPEENGFDEQRISADNSVCPNFYSELHYAALSLDALGVTYYGECCVVLRTNLIEHRASVFEENGVYFLRNKHVISGTSVPFGFRAPWEKRADLAIAKLSYRITATTKRDDFPNILIEPKRSEEDCDFIEVHIYEKLHAAAIEHVSGPVPTLGPDRVLWNKVKRKLEKLGATWTEI